MAGLMSLSAGTRRGGSKNSCQPFIPFGEVIGSRSPNYRRGQRFCTNCMIAFYTNLERCPYCGCILRCFPRGGRRGSVERRYIDHERYGIVVEA